MSDQRQLGTITSVHYGKEDHGILTIWLQIDFEGSLQGFGGICLGDTKKHPISVSYHDALCRCLQVKKIEDAVGKKVYALRCWGGFNEPIEGIENVVTDVRFIHWRWREEHLGKHETPLDSRTVSLRSTLAHTRRRVVEIEKELDNIQVGYKQW